MTIPELLEDALAQLDRDGCFLLTDGVTPDAVERLLARWMASIARAPADAVMRTREGAIFGSRNVLEWWPEVTETLGSPALRAILDRVLGPRAGVVRVLFFDKPPERSWTLPWHKDLTIQVSGDREIELPADPDSVTGDGFSRPTFKQGIPHVEAPARLLERMLSLRLHLDDQTEENGPLRVIPGSHRDGKALSSVAPVERTVLGPAGSILLMRPLLTHASGHAADGTARHRRVLQFELAGDPDPGDGFAWRHFRPIG